MEARLAEEEERVAYYLMPSSRLGLLFGVQAHLIRPHIDTLLSRGLAHMIDAGRMSDLARNYTLFALVHVLPTMAQHFLRYVKVRLWVQAWPFPLHSSPISIPQRVGSELVVDEQRDKVMVQNLLDLRAKLDLILEGPFKKDQSFAHAIKVLCPP